MKRLLLLLIFAFTFSIIGTAQEHRLQTLNLLKSYETSLNVIMDIKASKESLSSASKSLLEIFDSRKTKVYLDYKNEHDSLTYLPYYIRGLNKEFPYGAQGKFNYPKIKLGEISLWENRNTYGFKVDVSRAFKYATLDSSIIAPEEASPDDGTEVTESETETPVLESPQYTLDTVCCKSKFSKVTFWITCTKDKATGKFQDFKVASITKYGRKPVFKPLDKLTAYWVSLPKDWQERLRKELSLGELPSKYRLGFIKGIETLDIAGSGVTSLEPCRGMTGLKILKAGKTNITSIEPLQKLKNLRYVDISNTKVDTLFGLQRLTKMDRFDMNNLHIRSISALSSMTKLRELNAHGNKIDTIEALKEMVLMEKLDLGVNRITDISPLKAMSLIEKLDLSKNQIKDMTPLRGLTSMIELNIFNNPTEDISPISGMYKLLNLNIGYTKAKSLNAIKNFNYIMYLNIQGCLSDEYNFLSRYKNLREISVDNSNITSLNSIMGLEYLLKFHAVDTDIPKDEVQRFKKKHPKCKIWFY